MQELNKLLHLQFSVASECPAGVIAKVSACNSRGCQFDSKPFHC